MARVFYIRYRSVSTKQIGNVRAVYFQIGRWMRTSVVLDVLFSKNEFLSGLIQKNIRTFSVTARQTHTSMFARATRPHRLRIACR